MVTDVTDRSPFDSILLLFPNVAVCSNTRKMLTIKAKYAAQKCFYQYPARDVHCQSQAGNPIKKAVLATKNYRVLSAALATLTACFSQL